MQGFKNSYNKSNLDVNFKDDSYEVFSYQGKQVKVLTVFKNGKDSVAIVEDGRGEQFEVFKNQLYKV